MQTFLIRSVSQSTDKFLFTHFSIKIKHPTQKMWNTYMIWTELEKQNLGLKTMHYKG